MHNYTLPGTIADNLKPIGRNRQIHGTDAWIPAWLPMNLATACRTVCNRNKFFSGFCHTLHTDSGKPGADIKYRHTNLFVAAQTVSVPDSVIDIAFGRARSGRGSAAYFFAGISSRSFDTSSALRCNDSTSGPLPADSAGIIVPPTWAGQARVSSCAVCYMTLGQVTISICRVRGYRLFCWAHLMGISTMRYRPRRIDCAGSSP